MRHGLGRKSDAPKPENGIFWFCLNQISMFLLLDGDRGVVRTIPYQIDEWEYLYKQDEKRFPLLSLLDNCSHTTIPSQHVLPFIAELEVARSMAEMALVKSQIKDELINRISKLEKDLIRYSHSMWSIQGEKNLEQCKKRLEQLNAGTLPVLCDGRAEAHIDTLLEMVRKCLSNEDYWIGHDGLH